MSSTKSRADSSSSSTKSARATQEPQLTAGDFVDFRSETRMTQEEFSKFFKVPLSTVRNWEQGKSLPQVTPNRLRLFSLLFRRKGVV